MGDVRKVLVPIGFSDQSAGALKHAAALAAQTRAELLVLHVIPTYSLRDHFMACLGGPDSASFIDRDYPLLSMDVLLQEAAMELEDFIKQNVDKTVKFQITNKLRVGNLIKEITTIVAEEKIDLMVVELETWVLFPTVMTLRMLCLARKLPCPILLNAAAAKKGNRSKGKLIPLRPVFSQVFDVSSSRAFARGAL